MKNYFILIAVFLGLTACNDDFLYNPPQDQVSDDIIWDNPTTVKAVIGDLYLKMPDLYAQAQLNLPACMTDEAEHIRSWRICQSVNNGQLTNTSWAYKTYGWDYNYIRACNLVIEKIQKSTVSEDLKKEGLATARFMRAYCNLDSYFYYGPFQIIEKVYNVNDDMNIKRGTEEECINFMIQDFDAAIQDLPHHHELSASEIGKVTKEAAYAMKARLFLQIGEDEKAKLACEEIFKSTFSLFDNFQELFHVKNDNNCEMIFSKQYGSYLSGNYHDVYWREAPNGDVGSNVGYTNPTQNMVDAFQMKDGKFYNESALYDPLNPYDNRDPRFNATIMHDGADWRGRKIMMALGERDNPLQGGYRNVTGYTLRKFLDPSIDGSRLDLIDRYGNSCIVRLAEIYLIYAESMWNLGEKEVAREYINKVRTRPSVDMPAIPASEFKFEQIMHERRVELAFEGQRFWDICRWKIGPEAMGALIEGITVVVDDAGNRTYERKDIEQRVFSEKFYRFPINKSQVIDKFPDGLITQNPGWEN